MALKVKPTKSQSIKYTGSATSKKLKVKPSRGSQKTANPMKSSGFIGSGKTKFTRPKKK